MAKATQEPTTDLVPLEQDVGPKLAAKFADAHRTTIAERGDIADIVNRILDAPDLETMNKVFSNEGSRNSRDLAKSGTHVRLLSAVIRPSDFPDRDTGVRGWYGQYAAVDLDTGETIRINSTSKAVLASFVNADALGVEEITGKFVFGAQTPEGYNPVNFYFD